MDTTVGQRLIFLMDKLDMKQSELAQKIGISKQSLYKYIHCKCEPRAEIIARMAVALNTSADYIVGLTNDPAPVKRDEAVESNSLAGHALFLAFTSLSHENQIRILERIEMMKEAEK